MSRKLILKINKLLKLSIKHITRHLWNHVVHDIIINAMKQRVISSVQAHIILGMWNRECFPERNHLKVEVCNCTHGAYENILKPGHCMQCGKPLNIRIGVDFGFKK